jgi:selenocysteine lyase/cysteine desulfurase
VIELESYLESFTEEPGYLDWAAFGPLSPSVQAEAAADAELLSSGRRSGIDLVAARGDEAREHVAEVMGVAADEVTLQPSTTYGLMHALFGLSGEVLLSPLEFPSFTVTARRAQDALGRLKVRDLDAPGGFVTADAVRGALTDDITAVAVSLLDYRTGYVADLTAIRDVIGDRLLIVDAIQAFGVVDADYAAADVVSGNGYKWLRAGRGTGFTRFSDRARERIEPVLSGPLGMDGDLGAPSVPAPRPGAAAYTVAPTDALAAARLGTAVRDIRDVGVAVIAEAVRDRAHNLMALADRYGLPVLTPRNAHAGIVALEPDPQDAGALAAALANHGVTATARQGIVRVSAHAGTAADTLQLFGDALADVSSHRIPSTAIAVVEN